ncbi:MAG: hypothetical protein J5J00_05780 [Deltaproteobacteria bacterium]|nr:hypothetical protein [Deltaproteobacteria bacterium]
MGLLADTHVHFYSTYDLSRFLDGAFNNLNSAIRSDQLPAECHKALFVCDREGQENFRTVFSRPESYTPTSYTLVRTADGIAEVAASNGDSLLIMHCRQLVSQERLELLALVSSAEVGERRPAGELVEAINAAGGVPVLCWSPGKWTFSRGKVAGELLRFYSPEELLVGDIAMRPGCFCEPQLFTYAGKRRIHIIAGSDPLPIQSDQSLSGSYCTYFEEFNGGGMTEVREALFKNARIVGKRNSLAQACRRFMASNLVRIKRRR